MKPPLASAEPLSRLSPGEFSFGPPPPIPTHQSTYPGDAVRELEQMPGVKRMDLIKMLGPDGKPKGLGFSIAGGVANEHYPGRTDLSGFDQFID